MFTPANKSKKFEVVSICTYFKNKVRVQGKAWIGEKAEHTRSM